MAGRFNRRTMIRFLTGAAFGSGAAAQALAQEGGKIEIFGKEIPDEIAGVKLPKKPLNLVRMVASIIALEKEADRKGLPISPLALNDGPALTPNEASFYEAAVPRLVTVIDRSEKTDPALSDQAGALLAQVHEKERVVPEALKQPDFRPSTSMKFADLKEEYEQLFASATLRSEHEAAVAWQRTMLVQSKMRYEQIGKSLNVPWFFIGAIHGLEASFNFRAHLHNGDFPLSKRTRQVPAGRPLVWLPPDDWESSARDALKLLGFANQSDWTLARTLYRLEAYNGFGYRRVRVPSPYLWCYSSHYEKGKYVADGKWSPSARSRQCGAATLLKALVDGGDVTFAG